MEFSEKIQQTPNKRPNIVIVMQRKITCWPVKFAIPADYTIKLKKSKKSLINTSTLLEYWKIMEHECDKDVHHSRIYRKIPKNLGKT